MKANDIQIDDWLYSIIDRYDQVEKKLCKVTGIRTDSDTPLIQCNDTDVWYPLDSYEPIPLTAEILEKNGFEWTTRKSYMVSCIGTVRMIWGFYKDCLSISDHSDDGGCQISSLKCKYIHQLQHALRLCGITREIIL